MSEVLAVDKAEEQRIYVGGVFRPGPGDVSDAAEVTPIKCSQGLPLWVAPNTRGSIPKPESKNSAEPFVPDFLLYRDTTPAEAARLAEVSQTSIVPKTRRRSLFQAAVAGIKSNYRRASSNARETTASAQYPEVGIAGLYSGESKSAYWLALMVEVLGAQAHREGIGLDESGEALEDILRPEPSQESSNSNESTSMAETGVSRSATVRIMSQRAIILATYGGYNIFHLSAADDGSWQVDRLDDAGESASGLRKAELGVRTGDMIVITSATDVSARSLRTGRNQKFANSIARRGRYLTRRRHPTMVISVN